MAQSQPEPGASQPYTGPGRTRPAPQGERCGGRGGTRPASLVLSSAGVGNNIGLVPDARPRGCSGSGLAPHRHSLLAACTFLQVTAPSPQEVKPPMGLIHGTISTYVNRRCRCPECAAASRAYCRERYRRSALGLVVELVDVEQVRTHLKWLSSHGIGWEQVAQLADVGRGTVWDLLHPAGPRRGVTPRVANAIFGVLPTLNNAADGALVDAAGTQRRLQALMLNGHTLVAIQLATSTSALGRVLTRDTVTARIARLVRAYYDCNWDRPPIVNTTHEAGLVARTRARARRDGYLPALAWDDDTMDDPTAIPEAGAVRPPDAGVRIHLEDVEDLALFGAGWAEVEHRIGTCRNSIEVACGRAGRRDLSARITSNRRVAA